MDEIEEIAPRTKNDGQLHIRVTPEVKLELKERCASLNVSITSLVSGLIVSWLQAGDEQ